MRYKVYDMTTQKDITDDPSLILKPDGTVKINEYGDEIELPNCIAIFFPKDADDYYIDEIGGIHIAGCGLAPDEIYCGECSHLTCKTCGVWEKRKKW